MASNFAKFQNRMWSKLLEPDTTEREGAEAEAAFLFEKTYECPCCGQEFKSKTVRTGKIKLLSTDSDLRPKYQQLDSLKYDAVACPHCGYAALSRFFTELKAVEAKQIKENITPNFKGIKEEQIAGIYTYEDAVNRHRLALLGAIVKRSLLSEQAYTCLKLGWILRGKAESLSKESAKYEQTIEELHQAEGEILASAYEGFSKAFSQEEFPMCGMDEYTVELLLADLSRRMGKKEEAGRWISNILVSRECSDRVKDKARDVKELLEAGA